MRSSSASQSQPVPVRYSQPRPDRRRDRAHRVELAGRGVHRHRGQLRVHPHPLLGGDGAGGVRVELVLVDGHQRGVHMRDARRPPAAARSTRRAARPSPRPARRTGRRSYADTQVRSACTGSSASSTRSSEPAAAITFADSFAMATACEATLRRRVHRQVHPGREPPGPAVHHPDRVPECRWCPTSRTAGRPAAARRRCAPARTGSPRARRRARGPGRAPRRRAPAAAAPGTTDLPHGPRGPPLLAPRENVVRSESWGVAASARPGLRCRVPAMDRSVGTRQCPARRRCQRPIPWYEGWYR